MKTIRLTLATFGLAAIGYGLWSAIRSPDITASRYGGFLLLVLVLHDAVLSPVFLLAGVLVRRVIPPAVRAIAQTALIASAVVALIAAPLALGYGRIADNRSALPLNYPGGILLVLAAIWLTTLIAVAVRVRSVHRTGRRVGHRRDTSGRRDHLP
jgi:hypothetical protein